MANFNLLFFTLLLANLTLAQQTTQRIEQFPVFDSCATQSEKEIENCFYERLNELVYENFNIPANLKDIETQIDVLFEVDKSGSFNVLYVTSVHKALKDEVYRSFNSFPKLKPAVFNGKPTYMQFRYPIKLPLETPKKTVQEKAINKGSQEIKLQEYDLVNQAKVPYTNPEYESQITIPLSHEIYNRFDKELNQLGSNAHTSVKPMTYNRVNAYYDFKTEHEKLKLPLKSWFGKKFFNEHLVRLQTEDYWFTADVAADLQIGKDFDADFNSTYNNTRAAVIQGGIGSKFNFYAAVYESQGRFANYFNEYANSIRPDGGNPAVIPARGIAKDFKTDSYDYPIAEGYISYTPNNYFNLQLGHGKNFIGDGYRSMLLSDNASPYPFFKINTSFWKIKYTNIWMSLRDIRPAVTESGSFRTKYMATHHLSYNVSKRLNIGLFESVLWENDNDRGFDFNYLNPVIFYRAIEFSTGSRGGNALIGLDAKYKFSNQINAYTQMMIDEFSSSDIFGGQQSYKNKIAYQLGLKLYDFVGVRNLNLQVEYNQARPYTYSHNTVVLNYGHNNQSLAHLWGANFREFLFITRYKQKRWYGHAKFILGRRGLELEADLDPFYGGNIYGSEDQRISDKGNQMLQGNTADFFYAETELGYLLNPATNLKVYANFIYRNLTPDIENTFLPSTGSTTWLNFGFRTDLFNWYYDF
ncbi:gliding motility protein RemB [uncultured Mesonia sp.]|uniref:gliding motility protein RemB n=1 Tax=uncultured Mesonia sp. TaxID=399731 RepID=UPI00374F7F49